MAGHRGDHETLQDMGDHQVERLKALDLMHTIGPDIRVDSVCMAKSNCELYMDPDCSCGLVFLAKLWNQPDRKYGKYVCQLDWRNLVQAREQLPENEDLEKWVRDLVDKYGPMEYWPDSVRGDNFEP